MTMPETGLMRHAINETAIFQQLERDLQVPRLLNEQVLTDIADRYGFQTETLAEFFGKKVPVLEDFELDLTFSPLFTPTLSDRKSYGKHLGPHHLSGEQLRDMIRALEEKHLQGILLGPDGQPYPILLKEVTIERYVYRLSLDRPVAPSIFEAIPDDLTEDEHAMVNMLAREEIWREEDRHTLLNAFLNVNTPESSADRVEKWVYLTDFVRTYRPLTLADLDRQLESLIQSCKLDLDKLPGRRFHDPELMQLYTDSETAHARDEQARIIDHYNHMIRLAEKLQQDRHAMVS